MIDVGLEASRRSLLCLYAALVAGAYAVTALPGLPYFESAGARNFAVALDILLFVLIARGSRGALYFTIGLDLLMFAFVFLGAAGWVEPGVAAVLLLRGAALAVLFLLAPLVGGRAAATR